MDYIVLCVFNNNNHDDEHGQADFSQMSTATGAWLSKKDERQSELAEALLRPEAGSGSDPVMLDWFFPGLSPRFLSCSLRSSFSLVFVQMHFIINHINISL